MLKERARLHANSRWRPWNKSTEFSYIKFMIICSLRIILCSVFDLRPLRLRNLATWRRWAALASEGKPLLQFHMCQEWLWPQRCQGLRLLTPPISWMEWCSMRAVKLQDSVLHRMELQSWSKICLPITNTERKPWEWMKSMSRLLTLSQSTQSTIQWLSSVAER